MAEKANLTPLEMEEQKRNETDDVLASRLLQGGTIVQKAQLSLHIRQWLTTVKQHGEVPSHVPEYLCRILIPFTTAQKAEEIRKIQTPDTFTASEEWLVRLRALIDEKADERLLWHFDKLPEGNITCGWLLPPNLEDLDHPPVNSIESEQSGHELRGIMRSGDRERMKENRDVFYLTGTIAWTVRAPYWHVALATDSQGERFLPDDVLDRALPKWRFILSGDTIPTAKYPEILESFSAWLAAEQQKLSRLGKPWPQIQPSTTVTLSASTPKTAGSDTRSSAFRSRLRSGGLARASSFEIEDPHEVEQTRLLHEILTEVKETKRLAQDLLQRNRVYPMTPNPQPTDVVMSSHQPYQGAQPPYMPPYPTEVQQLAPTSNAGFPVAPELTEQNQIHPPQYGPGQYLTPTPAPAEEDWQHWLGPGGN